MSQTAISDGEIALISILILNWDTDYSDGHRLFSFFHAETPQLNTLRSFPLENITGQAELSE